MYDKLSILNKVIYLPIVYEKAVKYNLFMLS